MGMARGNSRWMRKYKYFFLIGLVILAFQLFLATRFFELYKTNFQDDWQVQSKGSEESASTFTRKIPVHSNATILRLNELSFRPECDITGKEAISAIHRAKTQHCKQLISNITCLSLSGQLYADRLKGQCPNNGLLVAKALGCFKDESSFRLLSGYFGVNKKSNSPNYCMQLCLQSGFTFAGVQYSNECFCGNEEPIGTSKLPDSSCNMKCPGDKHATCGGYYTMNVYQTGIKKFVPQTPVIEMFKLEDRPVKIVFLLTLNGRALRQVKRLLKMLYHQNHYYYIHVDVREDYLFRELLHLEKRFSNIRLTRRRFATIWGGASLLTMLLSCMRELLRMRADWQWDFVLNLSESDYPVKRLSMLQQFLSSNRDRNFVKSHGRDTQRFLQKQGLDKTFVECDMRMWRVGDRQLPSGIQMDGGSDWIALSRDFVTYVAAEEPDSLIAGLLKVFQYTLLPAESFFHTALRNSRFCDTYIDNNLHVTNWKRKLGCKCQYKHVVDWCGCSPNDFKPEDWSRIQATLPRQLYFARKFEPIINQAILLKLELWLHDLEKVPRRVHNLHAYWQSLYNHLDLSPPADDGLMTALSSATRIWLKRFKNDSCGGAISIENTGKIIEATSFHYKDAYQYTLVHFKTKVGSEEVAMEMAFKPVSSLSLVTPNNLAKRVEDLSVSSDYDQKEQISRNFARIMSPYSDPMLIYRFAASPTEAASGSNITCLWLDPTGLLVDVTEISVDENVAIGYSKPTLKQPHLPGSWTVKLVHKQLPLAETRYLVTPLEFYSGAAVTQKQAPLLHGGSAYRPLVSGNSYDTFLGNNIDIAFLKKLGVVNSKKTEQPLRDWIDSLFAKFYVLKQSCVVAVGTMEVCGVRFDPCPKTNWSSFAPDPKSTIGKVNQTSGMFDIW